MARPGTPWFGLLVIGSAVEAWALRNKRQDHTASYFIRSSCCTHTRLGKAAFVGGWTALTIWLVPHIVNKENQPWG